MDAQQFLAEFGHIANAPGGVARLRELVLQLAIQGKLIEYPATPEASDALLRHVRAIKSQFVADRLLPREKPYPETTNKACGSSVPQHWRWAHFGELWHLLSGRDLEPSQYNDSGNGVPYITGASNIEGGTINLNRWTPEPAVISVAGDLLITCKGTIGKTAFNCIGDAHIARQIMAIRDFSGSLNTKFLKIWLDGFVAELVKKSRSMIPGFSRDDLVFSIYPVVPIQEQSRIVAKVDELMALCDQLEAQHQDRRKLQSALRQSTLRALAGAQSPHELQDSWQRLHANFGRLFSRPGDVNELRSLCVELAIRGALSPESETGDSDDASQLLEYLSSRKTGKRSAKLTQVDPTFELPTRWRWALFDDLLQGSESGWSPKCDAEPRRPGEWGVLKVSAVTWGDFRPDENKRLPPSLDPRPACEVKPGDFLLSRANTAELVARSVVTGNDVPDRLLMSDKIVRLTFIDEHLKTWANLVNNSPFAREYYRANATGTSDSMRNVSRQVIHELPIPLPPQKVQEAVIEKLSQLNELCIALEQRLADALLNAERLSGAAVAALTGITLEQEAETPVKAPQTELIAPLHLAAAPDVKAQAPLATILARHNGDMSARDLWQRFGGEIDAFYAQLKTEVAHGWIAEPVVAEVREVPREKAAEAAGA